MSVQIIGSNYKLAKIFSSDFDYEIPAYQRPYAWTEDEASELFDDLYQFYMEESDEDYFLGSIVLIKNENMPLAEVIDGQQRLTTLTILLAVVASKLNGEFREDFKNYIMEPGRASQGLPAKPRLALRARDRDFFRTYIQSLNFEVLFNFDEKQLENEAQRNILNNARWISNRINSVFQDNASKLCDFGSFIVQRCSLVAVSTPNRQSAFRIFSVLNSRGLDLLPTDILKSDIIGSINPNRQQMYTQKWEDIEVAIGRNGLADLFGHIRMIYSRVKPKKTLLEEFKIYVSTKNQDPEILINDIIEPLAEYYQIIKSSSYVSTSNAEKVNESLKWLNRIENSDWIPLALYFHAKYKSDSDCVFKFYSKLERLSSYLYISGKNINQRIERYCKVIGEIEVSDSIDAIPSLELSQQEKKDFISIINGDVYFMPARKRNFLILRLDSFLTDSAATYDFALLTIEHVLPQTVKEGSEWAIIWSETNDRDIWIHRLANLVPLNQKRNSSAQNFDFEKKKEKYFKGRNGVSSYVLTTQVLNSQVWDKPHVEQRQKELIQTFVENWDLGSNQL